MAVFCDKDSSVLVVQDSRQTVIAWRLIDVAKKTGVSVDSSAIVNFLHACLKRRDSAGVVVSLKEMERGRVGVGKAKVGGY